MFFWNLLDFPHSFRLECAILLIDKISRLRISRLHVSYTPNHILGLYTFYTTTYSSSKMCSPAWQNEHYRFHGRFWQKCPLHYLPFPALVSLAAFFFCIAPLHSIFFSSIVFFQCTRSELEKGGREGQRAERGRFCTLCIGSSSSQGRQIDKWKRFPSNFPCSQAEVRVDPRVFVRERNSVLICKPVSNEGRYLAAIWQV